MAASKLNRIAVPKPWGQTSLPSVFGGGPVGREPIGEIRFDDGVGCKLLFKYIFTSGMLSIQVHPEDDEARRLGLPSGKEEAWIVLDAAPGAVVGIGLNRSVGVDELRAAAEDGSIVDLVEWRPARPGDVFHIPPGTVHALGPGLVVAEVQESVDATLRFYDHGRGRELHLDQAVTAARLARTSPRARGRRVNRTRQVLVKARKFVVERWQGRGEACMLESGRPLWIAPLSGTCRLDGQQLAAGEVAISTGRTSFAMNGTCDLLVAYEGAAVRAFDMSAPAPNRLVAAAPVA